MHLLILGASGRTGAYAYKYALEQGHHVTVLTRVASIIPLHENLTIVEGSVVSENDMDSAMAAAGIPVDAILQFLNPHRASDNPWAKFLGPPRLLADATALAACGLRKQQRQERKGQQQSVDKPRLITLNAIGAGRSRSVIPWWVRLFFDYSNISYTYKDHAAADDEIEGNCGEEVSWTIAYAVNLANAGIAPVKAFGLTERGFHYSITRESLARWMVDVAVGRWKDEFDNKRVIVSN